MLMDERRFLSYLMKYDKYTDIIEHSGVPGMSWYHHDPNRRQQGEKAYVKGKDTEGFVVKSLMNYRKKKKEAEDAEKENQDGNVGGLEEFDSFEDLLDTMYDNFQEYAEEAYKEGRKKKLEESDKDREIDEETGLYLKNFNFTEEEDAALVNPKIETIDLSSGSEEDLGYVLNCVNCSIAYELRRKGYDVEAKPAYYKRGTDYENVFRNAERGTLYTNGSINGASSKDVYSVDATLDKLRNQGDGASGILTLKLWGDGGHAVHYSVDNGEVTLTDAQINVQFNDRSIWGPSWYLSNMASDVNYYRLDNASMIPEQINHYVRNRE